MKPKILARIGIDLLEGAVLDVLLEAKHEEKRLKTGQIGDILGIPKDTYTPLAKVILDKLKHKELVVSLQSTGGDFDSWSLTDEAYDKLK